MNFTIRGEKIYIKELRKPSKINGFGDLTIAYTIIKKGDTKYEYKVNFSMAAHICRVFLRLTTEKDPIDVMSLLCKEMIPLRNERQYPRLKTAHFRKPRYFIYRAA